MGSIDEKNMFDVYIYLPRTVQFDSYTIGTSTPSFQMIFFIITMVTSNDLSRTLLYIFERCGLLENHRRRNEAIYL